MTPNLTWLIERDTVIEPELLPEVVLEIQKQGMMCYTFAKGDLLLHPHRFDDIKDCVIVLGSIDTVSMVQRSKPWIPGTICDFRNFDCMTYYAYYGKYTTPQYRILPLAEAIRIHTGWLNNDNMSIFLRPCSGRKPFSGQVVNNTSQIVGLGKPDLPVVVKSVFEFTTEYRLFCSGNEILGASTYMVDGIPTSIHIDLNNPIDPNHPIALTLRLVNSMLTETDWRPDVIFTVDVGISDGKPFLIEINSFSCSGWYFVSIGKIIAKVKELAIKEYQDLYS